MIVSEIVPAKCHFVPAGAVPFREGVAVERPKP